MSEKCSICQDLFEDPKFLKCGHTFCRECIEGIVDTCRKRDKIVCPLCREVTTYPVSGARSLMDNFLVKTRAQESKILRCNECKRIARIVPCDHCHEILCDKCSKSHMHPGANAEESNQGHYLDSYTSELEGSELMDNEDAWLSQVVVDTYFHYDEKERIRIPLEIARERSGMVRMDAVEFLIQDPDICVVVLRGSNILLKCNFKGEELNRKDLPFNVFGICKGSENQLLMICDRSTLIYEYTRDNVRPIIDTESVLPFAISRLSNGRIVLLGAFLQLIHYRCYGPSLDGVMRIYDCNGRLLKEYSKRTGNVDLEHPRSICINIISNHIYVGDTMRRKISLFNQDCVLVKSYSKEECSLLPVELSSIVEERLLFPLALSFNQVKELVFASCFAPGERSIRILSSSLEFLGIFHSTQMFRVPASLHVDHEDKLYVGEGAEGIIHVYKLSQFINNLGEN